MTAGEQVRALTGLTVDVISDDGLTSVLALYGLAHHAESAATWLLLRAGADLLTRVATQAAASPRLAGVEDISIANPSPRDLLALAADLRARADALEEDAAGFVFGTAEFAPYGAAGGPEATTGGLL